MLLTSWHFDGDKLLSDNGNGIPEMLILGIVLLAVWAMLGIMLGFYIHKFNQAPSDRKIIGKPMMWISGVLGIVELICSILVIVFYAQGKNISDDPDALGAASIALVVIAFVILAALIIMMWFFLPYYGIAFTSDRILFMGEDIRYENITKIVIDEKTRATYVNYSKGRRNHGRIKFSAGNQFGEFIKENSELTGHKAEVADEQSYYQSLVEGKTNN